MSKRLEMIFKNEMGRNATIAVVNPREGLTGPEVQAAMNTIVANGVFTTPGGSLVEVVGARLVARDVMEIELA